MNGPSPMQAAGLLDEIARVSKRKVKIFRDGEHLRLAGETETLSRDLLDRIKDAKADLLEELDSKPEVVAIGSLHLGWEQQLKETAERGSTKPRSSEQYVAAGPVGRPREHTPISGPEGELARRRLSRKLVDTDPPEIVEISDKGLVASYGIFGAPGSGKTHLLEHLLQQIIAYRADQPELKYGALILDPKAALIDAVKHIARDAKRERDLFILNVAELDRQQKAVNLLSCGLSPQELGKFLVLAGRSAGASVSEPFWFSLWSDLFTGALMILHHFRKAISVRALLESIERGRDGRSLLQKLATEGRKELDNTNKPSPALRELSIAITLIERFYSGETRSIKTVETLISSAYGAFAFPRYDCFSPASTWERQRDDAEKFNTFYDDIIQKGKIVLVSISPEDPAFANVACILVKCLFQQTVRGRLGRYWSSKERRQRYNFTRPLVLACDEYKQVASEVPGQPIGDGDFFSICRQNGCMGLVATQSVNMLSTSALGELWRAVFSNFGAKIFMRLVDNETVEEVSKLAGKTDWYIASQGVTFNEDGLGANVQTSMQQREALAVQVLTGLNQGEGVLIGSVDGNKTAATRFFKVPEKQGRMSLSEMSDHA